MKVYSDSQAIAQHFDPETGVGNAYKFWANWFQVVKIIFFGWEKTLDHPAQFHYGLDFTNDLNIAINRTALEAFTNLKLTKGEVLDAGCGNGGASLILARKYPQVHFTGVTLSAGQISTARKRAQTAKISNVTYTKANYMKLPFADETFDGILGIETFCHVDDRDKKQLLRELFRVLKRKGRVAIFDAFLNERPTLKMHRPELHKRIFNGWALPDKISTASFFQKCASKQGFRVITDEEITNRILASAKEVRRRIQLLRLLTPLAKVFIRLRKFGIELPLINRTGLDYQDIFMFADTGEWQYEMFKYRDVQYRKIAMEKV